MPYYMTFFVDHPSGASFADIEAGLRADDPAYRIEVLERSATDSLDAAELHYGDDTYARIEINRPDEPLFHGDILNHAEDVEHAELGQKSRVIATLRRASAIVRIHVLWRDWDRDVTLQRLQPLWGWLFLFRSGLLHADGEGYYDSDGLIVEVG